MKPLEPSTIPGARVGAGLLGSLVAILIVVLSGSAVSAATNFYNSWLFMSSPLLGGIVCGLICNWAVTTKATVGWVLSVWAWGIAGVGVMFAGQEGIVCWLMAAPLAIPMYAAGYFIGHALLNRARSRRTPLAVSVVPLLALATLQAARQTPGAEVRTEDTVLEINAPP